MTVELVIGLAVVAALAYFLVFKKKGDVNNDGQVNVADVKEAAAKVEAKVEAVAEEAVVEVKKAATKVKTAAKKAAGKTKAAK